MTDPDALQANHDAILRTLEDSDLWATYLPTWDGPDWPEEVISAILVLIGARSPVYIAASGSVADGRVAQLAAHVITDGALIVAEVRSPDDVGGREISTRAVPLILQSLAVSAKGPRPGRLSATVTVAGEQPFCIPSRRPVNAERTEALRRAIEYLARRVANDPPR